MKMKEALWVHGLQKKFKKAAELGYQILEIFEVWHYEQKSKYDPETKLVGYSLNT